jgi:MSHA biogenesis protein MshI
MDLKLKDLLKIKPKITRDEFCGIEIRNKGLGFALVSLDNKQNKPKLTEVGFSSYTDTANLETSLNDIINKYNLHGTNCNFVLHPQFYRILLVNTPDVPAEEYTSAIPWQIKDMIEYPLEDLAVDIFTPAGIPITEAKKIYVVATRKSFLQNIANIARKNLLNPVSIDIREFAIRNLLTKIISTEESVAFLHINSFNCLFLIIKNNQVYFTRYAPVSLETLKHAPDEFVLEIRRSLEYYTNEFRENIPKNFFSSPLSTENQELLSPAMQQLTDKVNFINVNAAVQCPLELTIDQQIKYYISVGGALRK